MPFIYEFRLNGNKINGVEQGFTTVRKWEEALDEAKLSLPFLKSKEPYKMYGLLDIIIREISDYDNNIVLDTKTYEMLIISDRVQPIGSYGYYRHNIVAIEYSAKLDAYMIPTAVKSRNMRTNINAKFMTNPLLNQAFPPPDGQATVHVILENVYVKDTYYTNDEVSFQQVEQSYQSTTTSGDGTTEYRRGRVFIRTNAPLEEGFPFVWLSENSASWKFPVGRWEIEYGAEVLDSTIPDVTDGLYWIYKFYINVLSEEKSTMFDLIEMVRNAVGAFGGIETEKYHDKTRIFRLKKSDEEYLKKIQAPQVFLENATVRQVLMFIMSYVNALPRLKNGKFIDELELEYYNKSIGSFEVKNIDSISGSQNTNQIGSRSYSKITQALPNDMEEPNIYSPAKNGFNTVRSTQIQLTNDNFELKLPKNKELYQPIKLTTKITTRYKAFGSSETITKNLDLDLTNRFINSEEWNLKSISENFPTITKQPFWSQNQGLHEMRVSNLPWEMGATSIKLSDIFGTIFQSNLIFNVIEEAVYEYYMLHPEVFLVSGNESTRMHYVHQIEIDMPDYQNLKFNLEYISLEDLLVKQDKEDLSQINFYSELRHNQDETLVNIVRAGQKIYGDLQRTGNQQFSFTKRHKKLSEIMEVGLKDINNFYITTVENRWYNNYVDTTYYVTKHHNRIQQATFVDQTYRWRDNYIKKSYERFENYTDYLMIVPLEFNDTSLEEQDTLIVDNKNLYRIIFSKLNKADGLPVLGTKGTVALVRTDGMLDYYKELDGNIMISMPVSAYGVKQALNFSFGFRDNQIAGDGIVEHTSGLITTKYNQPIRYTDENGRFTRFGFMIRNASSGEADPNNYPLINADDDGVGTFTMFSTFEDLNSAGEIGKNPIVAEKDPLTNFNLTYQLSILSYFYGMYLFGLRFFTDNPLVNGSGVLGQPKLYIYTNGDYYKEFEDEFFIKSGYTQAINLTHNNLVQNSLGNEFEFIGISFPTNMTHWAIGNENGELLLACNDPRNRKGFKIMQFHHRPGVDEIGGRFYMQEIPFNVSVNIELSLVNQTRMSMRTSTDRNIVFNSDILLRKHNELLVNTYIVINRDTVERLSMKSSVSNDIKFISQTTLHESIGFNTTILMLKSIDSKMSMKSSVSNDINFISQTTLNESVSFNTKISMIKTIVSKPSMRVTPNRDIVMIASNESNPLVWQSSSTLVPPYDYDLGIGVPLPLPTSVGLKVRRKLTNARYDWVYESDTLPTTTNIASRKSGLLPATSVGQKAIVTEFDLISTTVGAYEFTLDITGEINNERSIWNAFINQQPQYFSDLDLMASLGLKFRVYDGFGYSYYLVSENEQYARPRGYTSVYYADTYQYFVSVKK